ncbi:YlbF family regulator [Sporomusa malonica]|uniref:Control of competence regulator ComK, YlbF/YmcA n=1 Tax=Sporomusa malonica TaxID=112901 RepID=A0A1W1Y800_9FIRM|nr:YlbF family regulator [Sporomusa malonica]SMC31858.1 Control of competence regulator ComK, YlbF/YmcA [Sporomusa malonica]
MIKKKAREIVEVLKNTNEFRVLQKVKANLERNSQLNRRVEQFMQDNAAACKRPAAGGKFRKEELEKNFDEMMKIPEIAAYFMAGQKFDYSVMHLHQLIDGLIEQALEEKNR